MNYERFKQIISKNIFFKVLVLALLIVILIYYFKFFFTTGVYYDYKFLKKEVKSPDIHYINNNKYDKIQITVKGLINEQNSIDVIYKLPNNINRHYIVSYKDLSNLGFSDITIKDKDGSVIFEGEYQKDSPFMLDKNGMPFTGFGGIRLTINGETQYDTDYEIPLKSVADFATSANETIRGEIEYLILAILLFILTIIDIRSPLLFFKLRHFLDVKDPEPSDFYITMQRISWVIYPLIGIILMIVAIN